MFTAYSQLVPKKNKNEEDDGRQVGRLVGTERERDIYIYKVNVAKS